MERVVWAGKPGCPPFLSRQTEEGVSIVTLGTRGLGSVALSQEGWTTGSDQDNG